MCAGPNSSALAQGREVGEVIGEKKKKTGKPGTVVGHVARWLFANMVLEENATVGELASRESIDL